MDKYTLDAFLHFHNIRNIHNTFYLYLLFSCDKSVYYGKLLITVCVLHAYLHGESVKLCLRKRICACIFNGVFFCPENAAL